MDNSTEKGVREIFPKSITPQQREDIKKQIGDELARSFDPVLTTKAIHTDDFSPFDNQSEVRIRSLSEEDVHELETYVSIARTKLHSLGFEDTEIFLPTLSQFQFIEGKPRDLSDHKVFGAECEVRTGRIKLEMAEGTSLKNRQVAEALYHEIAHYLNKILLAYHPQIDFAFMKSLGLTRTVISEDGKHGIEYDFLQEPLAELFAAFCLDNGEVRTGRNTPMALVLTLMEDYGHKFNISFFESFKRFFKANAVRDFTIFKDLVDLYGTEAVRDLNHLSPNYRTMASQEYSVALKMRIRDRLKHLDDLFDRGENILPEGFNCKIQGYKSD